MQRVGGGNVIEKVNSPGDKIRESTSSILHLTALTVKSMRYRPGRRNDPHVNWVWRQVTQAHELESQPPHYILKPLKSSATNDLELK